MDNVTHTLTAVALSQAGFNRKTRFATVALILAGNIPDVDVVSSFASSAAYLKYHRGLTHSILGATVLAGGVTAVVYLWGRRARPAKQKGAPPLNLWWLALAAWTGVASHLLLDLANSYGVRFLEPFSSRWFAWDIMFVVDPLLLLILVVGLGAPLLFRVISEEVGARKPGFQKGAIAALGLMAALGGLRSFAHARVISLLDSHSYYEENPERLGAFPSPLNPFQWTGIAETESAIHVLPVNALDSDIDMERDRVFHKPDSTPALTMATKTPRAEIFLDFARFPWAQVEDSGDGYDVRILDLRFLSPSSRLQTFTYEIRLDKNFQILSESFSFIGKGD
jgi:inner membrane protein